MKSMTGFGRGTSGRSPHRVAVTMKTYNARFLDIKIRGCDHDPKLESDIREHVQEKIIRGTVYITVEADNQQDSNLALSFDRKRFEAMEKIVMTIQKEYGRHLDIADLVSAEDIMKQNDDSVFPKNAVMKAFSLAFDQVQTMRINEGARLKDDLKDRISMLENLIENISHHNTGDSSSRKDRFVKRIQDLMDNVEVDETRLVQEIAIQAEKADITEEVIRCRSHISQFVSLMDMDEPVGKRCNFILQEMGREINTMGSKSTNTDLTNSVIQAKDELEKMREQIQNIL